MDLREKLASEKELASWDMLADHYKRGALFGVKSNLDLITVAVAIAEDNVQQVKIWLDNQELYQITQTEVEQLDQNSREKIAEFVIVQPYVLMKLI